MFYVMCLGMVCYTAVFPEAKCPCFKISQTDKDEHS